MKNRENDYGNWPISCGTHEQKISGFSGFLGNAFEQEEADPDGLDLHDPGAKADADKVMAGLLMDFSRALMLVAEVGTFGAKKYSRGGWQHVKDGERRYTDAMWRHLLKEAFEEEDSDSGILHTAQVAWNALARLELKLRRLEDAT